MKYLCRINKVKNDMTLRTIPAILAISAIALTSCIYTQIPFTLQGLALLTTQPSSSGYLPQF